MRPPAGPDAKEPAKMCEVCHVRPVQELKPPKCAHLCRACWERLDREMVSPCCRDTPAGRPAVADFRVDRRPPALNRPPGAPLAGTLGL